MADMNPRRCPKCGRDMERGLIFDRGDYQTINEPKWLKGAPERSFWCGVKTSGKQQLAVLTFRCEGCGYLESYAPASPASSA